MSQPPSSSAVSDTGFSYDGADLEVLHTLSRYHDWVISEFEPYLGGVAAEIGAGLGSYSKRLLAKTTSLELIEPSPTLFPGLARDFLGVTNVSLRNMTIEAWCAATPAETYDTILMINVLEHIEDDVAILQELFRILKRGGRLLLFVPALEILFSKLDRTFGHRRRYEYHDLKNKVSRAGFDILRMRFFDILGIAPWFVLNRLCGATKFNPALVRLYDAVGIPVTRAIERWVTPPCGKNLSLAAIRPTRG